MSNTYKQLQQAVAEARQALIEAEAKWRRDKGNEGLRIATNVYYDCYKLLDSKLLNMEVDVWMEGKV